MSVNDPWSYCSDQSKKSPERIEHSHYPLDSDPMDRYAGCCQNLLHRFVLLEQENCEVEYIPVRVQHMGCDYGSDPTSCIMDYDQDGDFHDKNSRILSLTNRFVRGFNCFRLRKRNAILKIWFIKASCFARVHSALSFTWEGFSAVPSICGINL